MAPTDNHLKMRPLLHEGTQLFTKKKYAQAEPYFRACIGKCFCGIVLSSQVCKCRNLVRAATGGTLKAELKKHCHCNAHWKGRCRNPLHMEALDGLVSVLEKTAGPRENYIMAAQLMILAPREPRVYLRFAKVLRLWKKDPQALAVYTNGIQIVAERHPSNHRELQLLRTLRDKTRFDVRRTDIVSKLPVELVIEVFRHFSLAHLVQFQRVSKVWRTLLTNRHEPMIQALWRVLDIQGKDLIQWKHMQSLVQHSKYTVTDVYFDRNARLHQTGFQTQFENLFRACRSLTTLKLQWSTASPARSWQIREFPAALPLPHFTRLHLGDINMGGSSTAIRQLVKAAARTLRELTVVGQGDYQFINHRIHLPELQFLRLSASGPFPITVNMLLLQCLAPNVKDFRAENVILEFTAVRFEAGDPVLASRPWEKLTNAYFNPNVRFETLDSMYPRLTPDTRQLYLQGHAAAKFCVRDLAPIRLSWQDQQLLDTHGRSPLPRLEKLQGAAIQLNAPMHHAFWKILLRPCLESGSLEILDIRPMWLGTSLLGTNLGWFTSTHVTYLGLDSLSGMEGRDNVDSALLNLASRFPNIRTLDISTEEPGWSVLAQLIRNGVRTIYHRTRRDGMRQLQEWAATEFPVGGGQEPVRIIYTPGTRCPTRLPETYRDPLDWCL
ncbi:hypothetical protein GGR56DRAFT_591114 [Xylariaceae sp. FL0804]|nr:hypothetical protein GGR56DRAFT_591114 [Xylariaceae sp. FL0804]